MEPLLTFRDLTKSIPGNAEKTLFADLSAEVAPGDKIAIVGPSGQGKSTLLRILALLAAADRGEISLHGKPHTEWQPRDWRSRVCYLPQHAVMLEGTVEYNLSAVSRLHKRSFERALAVELAAKLGLERIDWGKEAATLSGGEKQRIALIRALLLRPDMLLLDEPTASLDSDSRGRVEELLDAWHEREGTALIWITHDPDQAGRVSKRIWRMAGGGIREDEGENLSACL